MVEMINKHAKLNVLLVDDDTELCEVMTYYLTKIGNIRSVVVVHDGVSASQKLHNQKFDLILLDMRMPRKNGYDILEEFKNNTFNDVSKVLAMSGTLDMDILTIATFHGVKNFLVKPFTEEMFRERVLKVLTVEDLKVVAS